MVKPTTADQALVRKVNTSLVLDALRLRAPISRAELSARTGLNRSTISSIVSELINDGFVQETNLEDAKIGRPGMLLTLNPRGGFAVGVEIGVDFLSILVTDFVANGLWRRRVSVDPQLGCEAILQMAAELTSQALDFGRRERLNPLGIGIGVPGLVDINEGKLVFAPNLRWYDIPLRSLWSDRFGLPVFVENEANAAALGEYYFGAARGVDNFIYLSAGIGLGGGILIGGRLFRGSNGYGGEVGHMTIQPDGDLCGCGKRGCWETLVGPRAIVRRVRKTLETGAVSQISQMVNGNLKAITFETVIEAAQAGDTVALAALDEVAVNLGIGVANLVNIFNPQMIVLGGALNLASSYLLPAMQNAVCQNALKPACQGLSFTGSAHGTDACVMGTIALVLDEILREPILA
jgi:glucokinase-like ROK family protein